MRQRHRKHRGSASWRGRHPSYAIEHYPRRRLWSWKWFVIGALVAIATIVLHGCGAAP